MATKKFRTARAPRQFTPVDLGNGKVYTPICDECGTMEYAMTLDGERIGFATSPEQAVTTLNDVAAERAAFTAAALADEADGPWDDLPTDGPGDDDPETGPHSISLSDLRACVESSVRVGALAAIVSSGCYLHSRGLLVDRPELPSWTLVATVERLVAHAA